MKEFKVNDYITLSLEDGQTNIYVNGLLFHHCKYLLFEIPAEEINKFDQIDSIDEAADRINPPLERNSSRTVIIPPEVEFWGHCSNLQVWAESGYDSRLLHRSIAFPLLKKLTELGDPNASSVFEKEIVKRLESNHLPTILYLLEQGYLMYLNEINLHNQSVRLLGLLDLEKFRDLNLYQKCAILTHIGSKTTDSIISNFCKSEITKTLQDVKLTDITNTFWSLYEIDENLLERDVIEAIFENYNYGLIEPKNFYDIEGILDVLGFLGCEGDNYYKDIVLKALENNKCTKELLHFLIDHHTLHILTKKQLESLDIKKIYFSEESSGQVKELPEELGSILTLEEIIVYYGTEIKRLPNSLGNLVNLKILDLRAASNLRNLPNSILHLKNLKALILPSYSKVFTLPEWIIELNWLDELKYEVFVLERGFTFNLLEYIDILSVSELMRFALAIVELGRQPLKEFSFPYDLLDIFIKKMVGRKNKEKKKKILEKLTKHIEIFYTSVYELSNRGYIWDRKYFDEFYEKIGTSLSFLFKNIIKDSLVMEDNYNYSNFIFKRWYLLLKKADLVDLLKDTNLDFLNKLMAIIKDFGYYSFGEKIDDIIFKYLIRTLSPAEAKSLKDLKSVLKNPFLPGFEGGEGEDINVFQIEDQCVVDLSIKDSALSHLPASIGNLSDLEHLSIENTNITHLPEIFGNFYYLRNLSLSDNKLEELPKSFVNLNSLVYLNLSGNNLKSLPLFLKGLSSLEEIFIRGNKIKSIHPSLHSIIYFEDLEEIEGYYYDE